jgi:putative transposase
MPRMPRVEYEGAIYHVTVRMVGHAWETGRTLNRSVCLFRDDEERERFLDQLGERVEAYGIRLYAYCLMLTHFHLYLQTPKANVGRFMHSLETAYTVYGNTRRHRHGPLVGRYKAKPVEGGSYHLILSRYIHHNPVRTKAALGLTVEERLGRLRAYPWSSYRAYAGRAKAPAWLACGPILALCGRTPPEQRREYARYVTAGLGDYDGEEPSPIRSAKLAVGGAEFVDWIRERLIDRGGERKSREDACLRHLRPVLPVDQVLEVAAELLEVERIAFNERRRNSDLRGVAARVLCRHAGLTHREAAAVLGMGTGAAAGQQIQRLDARMRTDPNLRRRVTKIDTALNRKAAG